MSDYEIDVSHGKEIILKGVALKE